MKFFRVPLAASGLVILAGLAVAPAQTPTYPSRVIKIVVPFAAGGQPDVIARLFAQHLATTIGPTIIDNRPGANTTIGTKIAAQADPDGHTLLYASATSLALAPALGKVEYDPVKSFAPVATFSTAPFVLIVGKTVPANTVGEFIAYAKANPGKLNFTVAGTQNVSHLAPVLLFAQAGIDLVMVPQKSEPQAISDLMAGQVDLYFGNSSSLLPHINSDKIRLIAVGTPERIAAAPDIPTVAETIPGFQFSSWNGFFAPAATPEPVAAALRKEISAFAKSPEVSGKLSKLGIVPGGLSLEASQAALKNERDAYAAAIKVAGIEPAK